MNAKDNVMSISDKLAKIKNRAASLNTKTDRFNSTVESIEKGLAAAGAGIEFFWEAGPQLGATAFRAEDDPALIERKYFVLGYGKLNGEWRILVQDRNEWQRTGDAVWQAEEASDVVPVALVRASRTLRIEAAPHLEGFLDALHGAMETMEVAVDKANELVTDRETLLTEMATVEADRILRLVESAKKGRRSGTAKNSGSSSGALPSTRATTTTSEILNSWKRGTPCDVACRLCGIRVVDDAPDAIWQGFNPGVGGGFRIDEHVQCDGLLNLMDESQLDPRSESYLDDLGIEPRERERARRVLRGKLGHQWPVGNPGRPDR
jgi:hypothetical protein